MVIIGEVVRATLGGRVKPGHDGFVLRMVQNRAPLGEPAVKVEYGGKARRTIGLRMGLTLWEDRPGAKRGT